MRHPILVLLVFCGVALPGVTAETPARPSPPGSRRALLVAVSRYDRGQKRPWRNLTSYLDSQAIRSVLIRRFGFRPQDVLVVSDAGATRRGIIGAFENHLIAPAKPGDVLVFHFAGHGQPIADDNGDELDGLDESLVPYDYVGNSAVEGSRTNIRDDGLNELLARATAKLRPGGGDHGPTQGSTLVLLDCCHAGSATRGRQVARGRGWDERLDGPRPRVRSRGLVGGSGFLPDARGPLEYALLAACQDDQSAYERLVDGECRGGAFSQFLARALWSADAQTSYRELFQTVSVQVAGDYPLQNPQLEGRVDQRLFSGLAAPVTAYPRVVEPIGTDTVTLSAGQVHGATAGARFALYRPGHDVRQRQDHVAEAEVVQAHLLTSVAKLKTPLALPGRRALLGGKAVLIAQGVNDRPLRVWLAGTQQHAAALRRYSALVTTGVSNRDYDVRVVRKAASLQVLRNDETLLAAFPENGEAAVKLQEALLGAWRWRFLCQLQQDDPASPARIKLRVIPVEVAGNGGAREVRERKDVVTSPGGRMVLRPGDRLMLDLHNPSEMDLFVTVLELAPDGSVNPLFPHPNALGVAETRIPAGQHYRVPLPFLFCVQPPLGPHVFKVIATRTQEDFTALLTRRQVEERGRNNLLRGIRVGSASRLALLLLNATLGRRHGNSHSVDPTFWATDEDFFDAIGGNGAIGGGR